MWRALGDCKTPVADKLLPALLNWRAEPVGPAIDKLSRAERLGGLTSADTWLALRRMRNRMIHDDVRDVEEFAQALNSAHDTVPLRVAAAPVMEAPIFN